MAARHAIFLNQRRDHGAVDLRVFRRALPSPERPEAQERQTSADQGQADRCHPRPGNGLAVPAEKQVAVPPLPMMGSVAGRLLGIDVGEIAGDPVPAVVGHIVHVDAVGVAGRSRKARAGRHAAIGEDIGLLKHRYRSGASRGIVAAPWATRVKFGFNLRTMFYVSASPADTGR